MIKHDVDLRGVKPQMAIAFAIIQAIYHRHGYDCVITRGSESAPNSVPTSLHPSGNALDFRIHHILRADLDKMVPAIKAALGPQFDVLLTKVNVHVEFQPKEPVINPEDR